MPRLLFNVFKKVLINGLIKKIENRIKPWPTIKGVIWLSDAY